MPSPRLAFIALLLLVGAIAGPADATTRRVALDDGVVAALTDDLEIFLEAPPRRGEGLFAFSRRLTGSSTSADQIAETNGRPRRLLSGVRYRVPYELLTNDWKLRLVRALFPDGAPRPEGWYHAVPEDGPAHNLWRIALWLTGEGQSFREIRDYNRLPDEMVPPGRGVIVPAQLLLPAFRGALPPLEAPSAADFAYEREASGEYLTYRLKRGEALYSAVVVRFTGNTFADEVNALARELAELNGIRDITDMPVGQRVKVPFDLLLPEFLPANDPRRQEYETNRAESAKYSNTVRSTTLAGITVILDAGHGGDDPGTNPGGVWESTYVYDIMLRIKAILEGSTAAQVVPTTRDGGGWKIVERDKLPRSRGHVVLTEPPYRIGDTTVGTHLRWYLANSIHRTALEKNGGDPQKTVFISLHADALVPSVRGAMAYIPAASLTRGEYGKTGTVYAKRREVREKPRVSYSWKERVQGEGLSRQLATHIIQNFKKKGLAVHNDKTIRDRVIRCRRCRAWVPAVVRYNAVPARLLLEIGNLNNSEDRRLLQTRDFRQRVAEAIVEGLLEYYGEEPPPPVAAGTRP